MKHDLVNINNSNLSHCVYAVACVVYAESVLLWASTEAYATVLSHNTIPSHTQYIHTCTVYPIHTQHTLTYRVYPYTSADTL